MSTELLAVLKAVFVDGSTPLRSRRAIQPIALARYSAGRIWVECVNSDGSDHSIAYDTLLGAVRRDPADATPVIALQFSASDTDPDGNAADHWAYADLIPGHWVDCPVKLYHYNLVALIGGDPDDPVTVLPHSEWRTTPNNVHPGDDVEVPDSQQPLAPGPQGVPGPGLGHVADYASLPDATTVAWEFYATDDDDAMYYSDGVDWLPVGALPDPTGYDDGCVPIVRSDAWVYNTRLTADDIDAAFTIAVGGNPATQELGATTSAPTITATFNRAPTGTPTVNDGTGAVNMTATGDPLVWTHTYGAGYTKSTYGQSVTWTVTANGKTGTATTYWYAREWYGGSVVGTYNEAFIEALTSASPVSSVARNISITGGAGVYGYYWIPTAIGSISTSTVSGFNAPYTDLGVVVVTNAFSVAVSGHLFKTDAQFGVNATWAVT